MNYQLLDKRLNELMMMVLVRQIKEWDMMLHIEKSDMFMLVAETEVGDKTADDVDKLACAADVVKPRQVDLNLVTPSSSTVARGEDLDQLIRESSCRVVY
uniref:Uncharacterized protein n=1 Tax=Tanacetum cinerariifolium TaxID=118510 RepID=A0A6L2MI96_TANCI|nr:hypothetical protein [Tanacetum cinerariifolium]